MLDSWLKPAGVHGAVCPPPVRHGLGTRLVMHEHVILADHHFDSEDYPRRAAL